MSLSIGQCMYTFLYARQVMWINQYRIGLDSVSIGIYIYIDSVSIGLYIDSVAYSVAYIQTR